MRYFVFFFDTGGGGRAMEWRRVSKGFPSHVELREGVAEHFSISIDEIIITGWKELTEEDYMSFTNTKTQEE